MCVCVGGGGGGLLVLECARTGQIPPRLRGLVIDFSFYQFGIIAPG